MNKQVDKIDLFILFTYTLEGQWREDTSLHEVSKRVH